MRHHRRTVLYESVLQRLVSVLREEMRRIKALLREPDGMTLLYKRLSVSQGRYRWPRNKSEVRNLTWQEFDWLMSGLDIDQPKAIKVDYSAAS